MTPRNLSALKGLLSDLDGLLLDTEVTYQRAWAAAAKAQGKPLAETFLSNLFGLDAAGVFTAIAEEMGESFEADAFFEQAKAAWWRDLEKQGLAPMPGAEAFLETLKAQGIPNAIVTNSERVYAEHSLLAAGLRPPWPELISRDQVARGKPAPDLYLKGAWALRLDPKDCLVLEDSAAGLEAARAAGAWPVLIQRDRRLRDRLSPLAVLVFEDLPSCGAALAAGGFLQESPWP